MFTFAELMFLLSIDDARGTTANEIIYRAMYYGLAGALLTDLVVQDKAVIEGKLVSLNDNTLTGDKLLDKSLELIKVAKKPRKPEHWVRVLPTLNLPQLIVDSLVAKSVLMMDEKHYKLVIPFEVYGEKKASAKYWVKQHLRAIVFADKIVEPQDVILLNLLKSCSLLKLVFTRDERRAAQMKVEELNASVEIDPQEFDILASINSTLNTLVAASTAN